jgi:hypothetical protein
MKLIALSLLLLTAALEEPEPIDDQERNDEVAQAQQRAKLVACLSLTRARVVDYSEWTAAFISESKHDASKTKHKLVADLIYNCNQAITLEQAESVLSEDFVDLTKPEWKTLMTVDEQQFKDPKANIEVRPEQLALIEKIKLVTST